MLIAGFIMVTAGASLQANGIAKGQAAVQLPTPFCPMVGAVDMWLFAWGIIGTGLLAVPVLS
ncbi:hypothetical protein [Azospirillum canadense]|uniref:hypothetical protein n=1 Tax=Azospirillum canadense TaxID=403962 RepID=UPI002227C08D|nr:hypothetical protein [Azospirillum canadense]MCW2241629.1 hypothetical protein [Azospirillum canadense]